MLDLQQVEELVKEVRKSWLCKFDWHMKTRVASELGKRVEYLAKLVERMLMCKYVRRELRALTRDDLENFFSAFQALMTYSTAEGQSRWGENYRSLDYFVNVHLNAAADHMDDQAEEAINEVFPSSRCPL